MNGLQEESKLLVATPAKFKKWFNVDVQDNTEVISIDRKVRRLLRRRRRRRQHTAGILVYAVVESKELQHRSTCLHRLLLYFCNK